MRKLDRAAEYSNIAKLLEKRREAGHNQQKGMGGRRGGTGGRRGGTGGRRGGTGGGKCLPLPAPPPPIN